MQRLQEVRKLFEDAFDAWDKESGTDDGRKVEWVLSPQCQKFKEENKPFVGPPGLSADLWDQDEVKAAAVADPLHAVVDLTSWVLNHTITPCVVDAEVESQQHFGVGFAISCFVAAARPVGAGTLASHARQRCNAAVTENTGPQQHRRQTREGRDEKHDRQGRGARGAGESERPKAQDGNRVRDAVPGKPLARARAPEVLKVKNTKVKPARAKRPAGKQVPTTRLIDGFRQAATPHLVARHPGTSPFQAGNAASEWFTIMKEPLDPDALRMALRPAHQQRCRSPSPGHSLSPKRHRSRRRKDPVRETAPESQHRPQLLHQPAAPAFHRGVAGACDGPPPPRRRTMARP